MFQDTLEDLLKKGGRRVRRLRDEDLGRPLEWLHDHLPYVRDEKPSRLGPALGATAVAAAGAGVAFWWWTQWAQGRAEAAERAALDARGGAEGAAHPEAVMAHSPAPPEASAEVADPSAAELAEPAQDVLAHAPPPAPAGRKPRAAAARPAAKPAAKVPAAEAALLASAAGAPLGDPAAEVHLGETPSLDAALAKGRGKRGAPA